MPSEVWGEITYQFPNLSIPKLDRFRLLIKTALYEIQKIPEIYLNKKNGITLSLAKLQKC